MKEEKEEKKKSLLETGVYYAVFMPTKLDSPVRIILFREISPHHFKLSRTEGWKTRLDVWNSDGRSYLDQTSYQNLDFQARPPEFIVFYKEISIEEAAAWITAWSL